MKRLCLSLILPLSLLPVRPAAAFCGFYVARADTKLFNKASQVALVRDGDRTVLTMANDYRGEMKEFALVVPVPTILEKGQIHVGEKTVLDHLDAYSGPRLVEYFDPSPCGGGYKDEGWIQKRSAPAAQKSMARDRQAALGVTVEASYTVGEYDILILSAKESGGLETWLVESGYRIPAGASKVLGAYIGQGMKFFVAKVNLGEKERLGFATLRPLQVAYESPKFMLPIRLGMANADGPQELFVYTLTKKGRVETTNYRTVKLPSDADVPEYVKGSFPAFYKALFTEQVRKEDMRAVFLEYAWDMGWCDPCASQPLSPEELKKLGVFWLDGAGAAQNVFLTRLHVRYDGEHFPDDLVFQETADRANFQARYVLHHPWSGDDSCAEADGYRDGLAARREKEAETLARLTGWSLRTIRREMRLVDGAQTPRKRWWQKIWG